MPEHTLPTRLPIGRYLLVGGLTPAFFVWLDDRMLAVWFRSGDPVDIALSLGVFVVQVGVFGVLCGKLIDWPLMRWLIYGWCWAVVNLQIFTASSLVTRSYYTPDFLLPGALFAAQVGLVTIWAILGATWWGLRLPVSLVLGALLAIPLVRANHRYSSDVDYLFTVQSIALVGLCLALRRMRFRLLHEPSLAEEAELRSTYLRWKQEQPSAPPPDDTPPPAAAEADARGTATQDLRKRQFGLRHVMLWMTSLAVVLGIARGLDLMSPDTIKDLIGRGWIGVLTMGLLSAIVLIVALWAGLGAGRVWLRWLLLALVSTFMGALAAVIDAHSRYVNWLSGTPKWSLAYWQAIATENWVFIALNVMAAALLYASLLIFRTLGYRLLRA